MRPQALGFILGIAAWVAAPSAVRAQQVIGSVRDAASGVPIPGAVVTLLDSASVGVARTLTNERGQFRAVLLRNVIPQVHVVRLGFRPVTLRMPEPRDGTIRLDVVMSTIPLALQAIEVIANRQCPVRPDNVQALAVLEQARAGLLATVVARSESPATMKRLRAMRTLDGTSDDIVHQRVHVDSSRALGSFGAPRTAADFVRTGFTADSLGLQAYFGPDAEVLVDDAFARLYCFRIMERDRARPSQIGLGFRPAARRPGRIDISGAIWIDTVARALVDIEFRYVGLDLRMDPFHPGGYVSFREMPNGAVVIDRWSIRTVGVKDAPSDRVAHSVRFASDVRLGPQLDPRLFGLDGVGELASVEYADGHRWRAKLGTVRLRVANRNGRPAAGIVVRLADTNYEGVSDSSGVVEIADLIPGPYRAEIVDPDLAAIGMSIPTSFTFTAERDSVANGLLIAPAATDYVVNRCRGGADGRAGRSADVAVLVGRVVRKDGEAVAAARWSLRPLVNASGSRGTTAIRDADVGSDGVFQYCNLRRHDAVELVVRADGYHVVREDLILTKPLTIVSVRLQPRRR